VGVELGRRSAGGATLSYSEPSIIERSVEKTNVWLKEIAAELGSEDRQYAYRALRAVLHALRDRLTVDAAAKLAAQLPMLVRGIYYEDWDPSATPAPVHDVPAFLDRVAREGRMAGETEASLALTAVMRVLYRHMTRGELAHLRAQLPRSLAKLIDG
jgi:uncharacterized protein (DUF2267 family)